MHTRIPMCKPNKFQETRHLPVRLTCGWFKNKELQISPPDVIISLDIPWFSASPDGLVYNAAKIHPWNHDPYSIRNNTLHEAITTKGFCLDFGEKTSMLALLKSTQ